MKCDEVYRNQGREEELSQLILCPEDQEPMLISLQYTAVSYCSNIFGG